MIGKLIIFGFQKDENLVFKSIMNVLNQYSDIKKYELDYEPELVFPGLRICPDQRKIYCDEQEVHLTAKEYDLLMFLVLNKGRVLTYSQIYEKVWKKYSSGNENAVIGYHICNLREKLHAGSPDTPFVIRCVREIGYCFEVDMKHP